MLFDFKQSLTCVPDAASTKRAHFGANRTETYVTL